jgi:hypothetical protein
MLNAETINYTNILVELQFTRCCFMLLETRSVTPKKEHTKYLEANIWMKEINKNNWRKLLTDYFYIVYRLTIHQKLVS